MNESQLLRIENLKVVYKTDLSMVRAVNNIDLTIERGETLGLVGETGAGKTTTALSILNLLPDRIGKIVGGSIWFGDLDLLRLKKDDIRAIRGEKISMIFQDPMTSLNPVLVVGDQIAESIELHNKSKYSKEQIQKKVDEILELVGIPAKRKYEYPHQFSGGMKQRVVIAMALVCNPELLIADEPTTALDVTIQAQVLNMIGALKDKFNTSMLLITHDLGVVAQTCDKVAIMYAGEIIEYGSIRDIFKGDRHHPYTQGLFGSIPDLNVESSRLNSIEGLMPDPTELPRGCKFHPRCPMCMDICQQDAPEVYTNGIHMIRCNLQTTQSVGEV